MIRKKLFRQTDISMARRLQRRTQLHEVYRGKTKSDLHRSTSPYCTNFQPHLDLAVRLEVFEQFVKIRQVWSRLHFAIGLHRTLLHWAANRTL